MILSSNAAFGAIHETAVACSLGRTQSPAGQCATTSVTSRKSLTLSEPVSLIVNWKSNTNLLGLPHELNNTMHTGEPSCAPGTQ